MPIINSNQNPRNFCITKKQILKKQGRELPLKVQHSITWEMEEKFKFDDMKWN